MLKPRKGYSHKRQCEERISFTLGPQSSLMLHAFLHASYEVPPPPSDFVWRVLMNYLVEQVLDRARLPVTDPEYIHVSASVIRRAEYFLRTGQ